MYVPPPVSGNTPLERALHSVLLRKSLPGLPPEIATEDMLRRARIFQPGSCAVIPVMSAILTWYATTFLTSGTGIILLIGGHGGWVLARFPGLIQAVLAFDGASGGRVTDRRFAHRHQRIACSPILLPCRSDRPSLNSSCSVDHLA